MATDHLAKASRCFAEGDNKYAEGVKHILAYKEEHPDASNTEIGSKLSPPRDESWVRRVVRSFTNSAGAPNFKVDWQGSDRDATGARRLAREKPEAIAEAIAEAPPQAQRKIADAIVKRPVDRSLSQAVNPPARQPREPKSAETKLGEAVFALWEVGELLMDEVPAGEAKVRMTALAEKSQRLSEGIVHLLGTGEFEAEFRELVEEVGADA